MRKNPGPLPCKLDQQWLQHEVRRVHSTRKEILGRALMFSNGGQQDVWASLFNFAPSYTLGFSWILLQNCPQNRKGYSQLVYHRLQCRRLNDPHFASPCGISRSRSTSTPNTCPERLSWASDDRIHRARWSAPRSGASSPSRACCRPEVRSKRLLPISKEHFHLLTLPRECSLSTGLSCPASTGAMWP